MHAVATTRPIVARQPPQGPSPPPSSAQFVAVTAAPTPLATAGASALPSPPPPAAGAAPRLAIIIDDCGQWPVTERAFIALPYPLTLSVLPHVAHGPEIAAAASAAGKGVMLHLPMETTSGKYPGPGTITTEMNDATIRSAVTADLAELPQATGVNNHEGSKATADARVMGDVADVLAADHAFFIDSRTTKLTVAETVAHEHGVRTARRNVFLDDVDSVGAVEASLEAAAALARANGSAIAIGHPRAATLEAVQRLAPVLAASGIQLTLAGDLVH